MSELVTRFMTMRDRVALSMEKPKIASYRDLFVWDRAMGLVELCYTVSKLLPQSEIYGLTTQLRRASVSIPSNIAEGHGRKHLGDYIHHLSIANGSLKEVETQLLIASRLKYIQGKDILPAMQICGEIGRMLTTLIQKLQQRKP